MKIEYELAFKKDLKAIGRDKLLNSRIIKIIEALEKTNSLSDIKNIKNLGGPYYRIRIGDYRLTFMIIDGGIRLARCLHRKEIYRYYPPK